MKITFVLDAFFAGGKERRCLQLIQGLNDRGYNDIQVIIVNNDIAYPELYDTNISLHIIDRKNKGLNFFQTTKEIYYLINSFDPDIVQVWGLFSSNFTSVISCIKSFKYIGCYVADCNRPKFLSFSKLFVIASSIRSDYIVGNSKAGLDAYNIPHKKRKVIYNGFNEKRLLKVSEPVEIIKGRMNINTKFVVSMVARVDAWKDQMTFINAAKSIIKERNDITFLIVGKGPNADYLKSKISDTESLLINFVGFCDDVENLLNITDVSVLCTNPVKHKEGVSNSILESMAFGVPAIATNDGGSPEIIQDGLNGYLIDAFNFDQLKSKILVILDDVELNKSLSDFAVETARTKFSLSKMVDEYVNMYNTVLK